MPAAPGALGRALDPMSPPVRVAGLTASPRELPHPTEALAVMARLRGTYGGARVDRPFPAGPAPVRVAGTTPAAGQLAEPTRALTVRARHRQARPARDNRLRPRVGNGVHGVHATASQRRRHSAGTTRRGECSCVGRPLSGGPSARRSRAPRHRRPPRRWRAPPGGCGTGHPGVGVYGNRRYFFAVAASFLPAVLPPLGFFTPPLLPGPLSGIVAPSMIPRTSR
jgi:hypothetical protein